MLVDFAQLALVRVGVAPVVVGVPLLLCFATPRLSPLRSSAPGYFAIGAASCVALLRRGRV